MYTGESFKKKGALKHFERFKSPGGQEPSLVSRAGVLQHFRAMGRTWGPRGPPSSPPASGATAGQAGAAKGAEGCRCAHLRLNTCGMGVIPPLQAAAPHNPEGGWCIPRVEWATAPWPGAPCRAPLSLCSPLFPLPMWRCRRTDSSPHPFLL